MSEKTTETKKARKPAAKKPEAGKTSSKKSVAEAMEPILQKVEETSIGANFIAVMKKYTVYEGRASRREFWMFVLACLIIGIALGILVPIPIVGKIFGLVSFLFSLATMIPSIMVGVRRLHDTDKTGWLLLLLLIPIVGWIIIVVFCVQKGTPGKNQYGPEPKD